MGNDLSLPDSIIKNTIKENLLEKYERNTLIRGLIQIVPYGGLVDSILTTSYNNILVDRAKTFYDELGLGNIEITPEVIKNEDFLHSYFATYKAALYTKQREKIRFFARLLNNGILSDFINNVEEYDDYLKILDELTYREIYLLNTLKVMEDRTNDSDLKELIHWQEFSSQITNDLRISEEELKLFLIRLSRTGCFVDVLTFAGLGAKGYTSILFKTLSKLIEIKDEDLVYFQRN
ncbi:hypothetical protein [Neobacillus cucumis]|uniref:Uncharacterized protein n=1 Tax=Neobacillus cucumis TaxID=1740721 RepID=A0A2N5HES6_9BACI|nr:hypothetical protein [Neobacillus cucumis]PLS04036.1 hypothetical protein CVD27_12820 [Neobacillus cucumis]